MKKHKVAMIVLFTRFDYLTLAKELLKLNQQLSVLPD